MDSRESTQKLHPIVTMAINGLSKAPGGGYTLSPEGQDLIAKALGRMAETTKFAAVRELAKLAYILEKTQFSPNAARAILTTTEAACTK